MFHRMFCKPMVHSEIYPIHCKRCFRNMGNEHPLVLRGCGLKLLYRGMIPTWFRKAMFLFITCFEGLISLQFQKICLFHVFVMFLHFPYMFVTCFLRFLSMFLPCFCHVYQRFFFQLCITNFYNFFFYVSYILMFYNLSSFVRHNL
jgi:hypothetical protein